MDHDDDEACSECGRGMASLGLIEYECHVCGAQVCEVCVGNHMMNETYDDEGGDEP